MKKVTEMNTKNTMPKKQEEIGTSDDTPSSPQPAENSAQAAEQQNSGGAFQWLKSIVKAKPDTSLRETIEEYMESEENNDSELDEYSVHEKMLITNILKLRDHTVMDVMLPRADIVALSAETSQQELLSMLSEKQHSRIPVYGETLDDIIGTIHIKDILAALANEETIELKKLVRNVPIVSPSLPVMDLMLMMKQMKKHMVLVVDEFGGIDGLVTINDIIESIVGEIEDEYDLDDAPEIIHHDNGTYTASARYDIEEFEEHFGQFLSEDERELVDTLGGLAFTIAGRVPVRGEILTHSSGLVLEVLEADRRHVNRILIKNLPEKEEE